MKFGSPMDELFDVCNNTLSLSADDLHYRDIVARPGGFIKKSPWPAVNFNEKKKIRLLSALDLSSKGTVTR
jgi:hypothetical protein